MYPLVGALNSLGQLSTGGRAKSPRELLEEQAELKGRILSEILATANSPSYRQSLMQQMSAAGKEPGQAALRELAMLPGGLAEGIDPITFTPKYNNRGNYWSDLISSAYLGRPGPNILNYIPRALTEGSSIAGSGMSPLGQDEPPVSDVRFGLGGLDDLEVIRGQDINDFYRAKETAIANQTQPPEQQEKRPIPTDTKSSMKAGDRDALMAMLGGYDPDSGLTYEKWLEMQLSNKDILDKMKPVHGAKMPRTRQRAW